MSLTSQLSDDEVAALLREMGQDIGPMNDATRCVYRRKLERLLLEQSVLAADVTMESPPRGPPRQTGEHNISHNAAGTEAKYEHDCGLLHPQQPKEHKKVGTNAIDAAARKGAQYQLDCGNFVLPQQPSVRGNDVKHNVNMSFNSAVEKKVEGEWEVEDIPEGSLRLEDDDDLMDDNLISFREPGRREFDVKGKKPHVNKAIAAEEEEEDDTEDDSELDDLTEGSLSESGIMGKRPLREANGGRKGKFSGSEHVYTAGQNLIASVTTNPDLRSKFNARLATAKRDAALPKKGGGIEMDDNHYVLSGSFSAAPLPTLAASSTNKRDDDGLSQLRQRTPFPPGHGATNDVGSYDRVALKPSDYAVSPRDPLSTYLTRCTPPPSTASQSIRPTGRPSGVQPIKSPKENGNRVWVILAAFVAVCALVCLLVYYNMEPGYKSPV